MQKLSPNFTNSIPILWRTANSFHVIYMYTETKRWTTYQRYSVSNFNVHREWLGKFFLFVVSFAMFAVPTYIWVDCCKYTRKHPARSQ